MLLSQSLVWLGLALSSVVAAPVEDAGSFSDTQQETGDAMSKLSQEAFDKAMSAAQSSKRGGCTPAMIKVRREWYVATVQREDFSAPRWRFGSAADRNRELPGQAARAHMVLSHASHEHDERSLTRPSLAHKQAHLVRRGPQELHCRREVHDGQAFHIPSGSGAGVHRPV